MNGIAIGAERDSAPLRALLIAPDRGLAGRFAEQARRGSAFQVLADLRAYPPTQVLEMRLRQLQPEVTLIDLVTDLERGAECVQSVSSKGVAVVGLHTRNDSAAILRSVSVGATEFLFEPFEPETQREARNRIARLIAPAHGGARQPGRAVVFAPAKPGSGASTLALHTAFALHAQGARVLIVDLDSTDATVTFCLGAKPDRSLTHVLAGAGPLDDWPELVQRISGVDILGGPELPLAETVEPARLAEFLERARQQYDCVVLDAPAVFHQISLVSLAQCETAFIVSSPDLASLHLARKAVGLISALGFDDRRYKILINRQDRKHGLSVAEMARIVNSPVSGLFPDDYFAVERAISSRESLAPESELASAIHALARELGGHTVLRKAT